jgi:putative membrane protein
METAGHVKRLDKRTILVKLIKEAPGQLIAVPAGIALLSNAGLWKGLLILGAFVALRLGINALVWWRFSYAILAEEMRIESGILNRTKRSIPWDRVQDVQLERGPLERLFGIAKVQLETGGAGSDEGSLECIALTDADALRAYIRERRTGAAPLNQTGDIPAPTVLELPVLRLIQAGFFNFSVLWLAVIYGTLQTLQGWLPFNWEDLGSWFGANQDQVKRLINPSSITSLIALFLVLGILSGIIQMLIANYGFQLSLEGNGLRRVRGLLTRSEVLIPIHRIQLVRVAAHWIKRRMGWSQLSAQTLGGTGVVGGMQELAPLANSIEAERVLTLAGGFSVPNKAAFVSVAKAHPWIRTMSNSIGIIVLAFAAAWFWKVALLGISLLPLVAVASYFSDKPHGFLLSNGTLCIREGWFTQKLWLLPVRNIQSFTIVAGPIQRRLGLATVRLDSAGASSLAPRIQNMSEKEARSLVQQLRSLDR